MSEELYDLVFRGELVRGFEMALARQNIQALFKVSDAQVDAMFSGNAIVLKKGLNFDTATKYRVAIKKAGCQAELREVQAAAQAQSPASSTKPSAPVSSVPPVQPSVVSARSSSPPAAKPSFAEKTLKPNAFAYQAEIDAPDFDLAAPGEDLLNEEERSALPLIEVDTSSLSVSEMEGYLLHESEVTHFVPRIVDTSGLGVAPAGVDLLAPEERAQAPRRDFDFSDFSLAKPGERLSEKAEESAPRHFDFNGISLAQNK